MWDSLRVRSEILTVIILLIISAVCGCGHAERRDTDVSSFTNDLLLPVTPVASQDDGALCWLYAMLATIETDRLAAGDSVRLSPAFLERKLLEDAVTDSYLSRDTTALNLRGMGTTALRLIDQYGAVPDYSYPSLSTVSHAVVLRKLRRSVTVAIHHREGLDRLRASAAHILDDGLGLPPRGIYLYSAQYTPRSFGMSVCHPREYKALTSFTHHPFYAAYAIESPDNRMRDIFMNVPIDSLMNSIDSALRHRHAVLWEGDISDPGFVFSKGVAEINDNAPAVHKGACQQRRQQALETFRTTDDHAMTIIGVAHDAHGRKYYIAKNSWGIDNPYGGLMYLSYDYVALKTICIITLG